MTGSELLQGGKKKRSTSTKYIKGDTVKVFGAKKCLYYKKGSSKTYVQYKGRKMNFVNYKKMKENKLKASQSTNKYKKVKKSKGGNGMQQVFANILDNAMNMKM